MDSQTLTFLMTDVQGSTRLWEEFPLVMPDVVRRHEEILQGAVDQNSGRLIKSKGEGDSTFSVFNDPESAVRAASEAQHLLAAENWPDGVSLKVRMAVHSGEAQTIDGDYFGPTVNRCARIREAGHGGQILTSDVVHERSKFGSEIAWTDHGVHRLRDLLRPEHLWQVQPTGIDLSFPKLKTLTMQSNNLPIQLTSFIGRRAELEGVKRLMEQNRLVTVAGYGGEGKTRLVLQLGAEIEPDVATSVWFVALSSLRTAKEVSDAIIAVLGGDADAELKRETVEKLGLSAGPTLLILDNAEHLISVLRPIVDLLLREAPLVRILVSSREPLHHQAEVLYRMAGLSVPMPDDATVETVEGSEAGQLFIARASARSSDFRLNAEVAKSVGEICRMLDGLPLAIEQAAPLVSIMSPAQILEKLRGRLDWLASEDPSTPERHRSLTATIRWSYELLTNDERKLFLMLSLFRDSLTLEASTFLAQSFVEREAEAVNLLRELVDKSLVSTVYDHDNEVRFRMLETLRQFAQPLVSDAADEWMSRYVDWYVRFAQSADSELYGPDQVRWVERFKSEEANIRKALEWCYERLDPRLLAIACHCPKYWMRQGHYTEAKTWIERAYPLASLSSDPPLPTVANLLGAFAFKRSEFQTALGYYKEALKLYEAVGDTGRTTGVVNNIAITLHDLGQVEEACEYYLRGIASCRENGDDKTLCSLLLNYSIDQQKLRNVSIAEDSAFEALSLAEAAKDAGQISLVLVLLCGISIDQAQFSDAALHAHSAMQTGIRQWEPVQLAKLMLQVCKLALNLGDGESAARLAGGAEVLLESAGADRQTTFLSSKQAILAEVANKYSPSKVHRWRASGRGSSQDQLIRLASEVCERYEP